MVLVFENYLESPDDEQHENGVCASVPGGPAYAIIKELLDRDPGYQGLSTVWFGEQPVWGAHADGAEWVHPFGPCGRHHAPYPGNVGPEWNAPLEGQSGDQQPVIGQRYPCWCCEWLKLVEEHHRDGHAIFCSTSNIFRPKWVEQHGAGSSETPDEQFLAAKPRGWGAGSLGIVFGRAKLRRAARVCPRTGQPLGVGCRWERQALDAMPFPVKCFFKPPLTSRCHSENYQSFPLRVLSGELPLEQPPACLKEVFPEEVIQRSFDVSSFSANLGCELKEGNGGPAQQHSEVTPAPQRRTTDEQCSDAAVAQTGIRRISVPPLIKILFGGGGLPFEKGLLWHFAVINASFAARLEL